MTKQQKHLSRERENPDPHEKNNPIPIAVLAVVVSLFAWAVYYIVTTQHDDDPTLGDRRTLATLQGKPKGATASANGAELYAANCVACHQATGTGIPGAFPPLAGSEWVLGDEKVLANILLHGVTGKLTVKQSEYNGAMPTFKDKLDDNEIAATLSYVRSNFGNSAGPVTADIVKSERDQSKERTTPWNGDDDLSKLKH